MTEQLADTLAERTIAPTSRLLGDYIDVPAETLADALTLQSAMRDQGHDSGGRIGEILLEMDAITLDQLLTAVQAQRVERLSACALFSALDEQALEDVSAVFQEISVPAGTQFITQHEKDPCLYVLAAGRLEVFLGDDREGEIRVASVFPGEPVGEMGYFSDSIRSASVRAREPSQLLRANYSDLTDCFESVPAVAQAFIDVVTTRMKKTSALYQEREARKPLVERSLAYLGGYLVFGKQKEMGDGVDGMMKRLVHTASRLTDADRATLFLVDPKTGELWSKVAEGAGIKEIRVPAGAGVVGWVVKNGRMLNVPEAYEDERFNPEIDRKTGYKTHTILCAPVRDLDNNVLGAVQVINKNLGVFNEDDESLLRAFADQASVATENFNHYRELLLGYERMAKALVVSSAIAAAPDLEQLAVTLGAQLAELLNCGHVAIYWLDEPDGELWTVSGEQGGELEEVRRPAGKGLAGYAAQTGEVLNVVDAYDDPRFDPEHDGIAGDRARSVLCVPVKRDDAVLAVLAASNKVNAVFGDEDAALLEATALQLTRGALLA